MTSTDKARIERKMKRIWVSNKAVVRAAIRQDFGTFVVKVFQTLHPGGEYMHKWHIDAITYALTQVYLGATRRVVINVPPRYLKSLCASVAFPAWVLGHDPGKKFACVSYSEALATDFARKFRTVITADWYRELFPDMQLCKDTETECETSRGGGRFVVPIGGSFTGRGADVIVIDDAINAQDAQNDKLRRRVYDWYQGTLVPRLNDKENGSIILVAQRLHEEDLCGQLLRDGGWSHLNLPAIAEEDQQIPIWLNFILYSIPTAADAARRNHFQARLVQVVPNPTKERAWVPSRAKLGYCIYNGGYQRLVSVHHMVDDKTNLLFA
jgi:hypothetical protein